MTTKTKHQGLTSEEVLRSRELHGSNVITPVKKESVWKLFIEKFNDPIIRVLIVAAIVSLAMACIDGEFIETVGILCAIFLSTGIAFWFEYDAMRRFEELNKVSDDIPVKVLRDGHVTEIPQRDVVVGDVVLLENGDNIPADGELISAISLKVNESTLTGEPEADKTVDPAHFDPEATYPSNMVVRGTTVMEGHGEMVVQAVGDATEFGRVSQQATIESGEKTPLNLQLERLSQKISKIGITLSIVIFVLLTCKAMFFGGDLLQSDWLTISRELLKFFMISVAMIVMAVPEGLPMSITLSLAMSMRRMLKTNNLVRKMHACETMGAVTVICTDKTGTLTQNQMRVQQMDGYNDCDNLLLAENISINSTAFLDERDSVIGNPTEGALLLWLKEKGLPISAREDRFIVDQLTFTTERKFMATLIDSPVTGRRILYIKGAPEIVRGMCEADDLQTQVEESLRGFQNRAMRTLGFAWGETECSSCRAAIEAGGIRFHAIAAIIDPVRPDVPAAVKSCTDAGISVKIVSGDTSATVREIARQIGLWDDSVDTDRNQITGAEFAALSDEELLDRVQSLKIMSRARPLDKQRLVQLLQQRGEIVAVTGDGTNDAPALNFAHVGLSMGSGTSVAKQASDITLLDDSFTSIATAVMWGRSLYKNIQRFVLFQLTINFVAIVVVFFGSLFSNDLPLTVTQILWVNIIIDTFAAMALASLPPNPEVMKERPRKNSDFIISPYMMRNIIGTGLVFIVVLLGMLLWWGQEITLYQQAVFFTTFVLLQFWNLFNARSFGSNHACPGGIGKCRMFLFIQACILAGQILIVSFGDGVFRVTPLAFKDWLLIIGGTSLILWGNELLRLFHRLKNR